MKMSFGVRILTCAAIQGMGTLWERIVGNTEVILNPEKSAYR